MQGTQKALRGVMEEDLTVPAMYQLNPCRQILLQDPSSAQGSPGKVFSDRLEEEHTGRV